MKLGIYGTSGLGREILYLAQQINKMNHTWDDIVFINDFLIEAKIKDISVFSFNNAVKQFNNNSIKFIIAVGEPALRKLFRDKIINAGYQLAVLVHPSASISDEVSLGAGTIICYNSFVSCNVTIGENVLVQPQASIGHDSMIGNDTVISSYVSISGSCHIGDETYIGIHVPIKEKANIGSKTIIGMGSVVTRDILDNVIALGNPARAMKENIEHKVFRKKQEEDRT